MIFFLPSLSNLFSLTPTLSHRIHHKGNNPPQICHHQPTIWSAPPNSSQTTKKKSTSNIATPNPSPKINLKLLESQQIKGVHGSSWVELRGFFNITHHGGSEKFNPTQMSWVGSGWTHGLDNFFLLLLLLNWPKIYISYLPPELINKLIFQLSCKQNMFKYPTELINKI